LSVELFPGEETVTTGTVTAKLETEKKRTNQSGHFMEFLAALVGCMANFRQNTATGNTGEALGVRGKICRSMNEGK
jgi:hypothetical protein